MELDIYYCFEVLALATACFKYKALLKTPYKYFLPFLIIIVSYETCTLYGAFVVKGRNLWIINIVAIFEFLFYSMFIRNIITSPAYKKGILISVGVFFVYNIFSLFIIHGFWNLNISGIILQTIFIILITGRYFWELLEVPFSSSLSLIKHPGFWLNTGVLFYYVGEFLFFVSFSYMAYKHNLTYLYVWRFVTNVANAILYGCLITCFLCLNQIRESSRLS
ncbi:hypothetical protein [Mucilaginibacter sp.]|uniref:hypothetical protein n=1 Tax=Mucilaginibacter sp. TaxID=1882438 RepID=UPI0032671D54